MKKKRFRREIRKKIDDVNSFNISINNIKETIVYFKNKTQKSKKKYKNCKTLNTILESVDLIATIAATSNWKTLPIRGIGLNIISKTAGIACLLRLGNKALHKLIIKKYNKYKKLRERDQQTIKLFDKLCRKSLQDNIIDENDYESLCKKFTKYVDEAKNESFLFIWKWK